MIERDFEKDLGKKARCVQCDYDLRGIGDCNTCPECGKPFNLNDPDTYRIGPQKNLSVTSILVIAFISTLILSFCLLYLIVSTPPFHYVDGFADEQLPLVLRLGISIIGALVLAALALLIGKWIANLAKRHSDTDGN